MDKNIVMRTEVAKKCMKFFIILYIFFRLKLMVALSIKKNSNKILYLLYE